MVFLIATLGLLGLIWGGYLLMRGSLLLGCGLFIIATCCFGHVFYNVHVGPLPITIDRLVIGFVLMAYFVQRRLGGADPKPMLAADWTLLGFMVLLCVSTLSIDFMGTSLPGIIPPIMRLLIGYLIPFALYWVGRQAVLTQQSLKPFYGLLILFGIYLTVTALLEITQQWSLVFPRYIADPKIGLHFERARGPMVHSVSLGLYLAICAFCAWSIWPKVGRVAQLAILWLSPLFVLATYLTYTRSAWLGLGLGGLIILGLTLKGRLRVVLVAGLVMSALVVGATKSDDLISFERDEHSAADTRKSVVMRGSFTYVSWKMFLDRPLLGAGFGQFYKEKLPYLSDRETTLELEEIRAYIHHNTVLSILTELGLVGLLLFLGSMAIWGYYALSIWRNPQAPDFMRRHALFFLATLAAYVSPLVFHELSYTSADNGIVFLLAGILVGMQSQLVHRPQAAASAALVEETGRTVVSSPVTPQTSGSLRPV